MEQWLCHRNKPSIFDSKQRKQNKCLHRLSQSCAKFTKTRAVRSLQNFQQWILWRWQILLFYKVHDLSWKILLWKLIESPDLFFFLALDSGWGDYGFWIEDFGDLENNDFCVMHDSPEFEFIKKSESELNKEYPLTSAFCHSKKCWSSRFRCPSTLSLLLPAPFCTKPWRSLQEGSASQRLRAWFSLNGQDIQRQNHRFKNQALLLLELASAWRSASVSTMATMRQVPKKG